MSHTIRISDDAYELLADEASRAGMQPDDLIEAKIKESCSPSRARLTDKKRRDALKAFIGAINTSESKGLGTPKDVFGQVVDGKMKRAGLKTAR